MTLFDSYTHQKNYYSVMGLVFQMFVYPPSPPIAQSASDVAVCLDKLRFFSKSRVRTQKYFLRKPGFVSTNFIPLQEFVSIGPLLLNFKHFFSMGRKVCYFLWNAIDSILGTRSIRPKCISFSLSILEIAKWYEAYEYLCPIGILNRK